MKAERRKEIIDRWYNHELWITFYCPQSLYETKPRGCSPIYYPRAGMFEDYKTELKCPICQKKMVQGRDILLK